MRRTMLYALILAAIPHHGLFGQTPSTPTPDASKLQCGTDSLEVYLVAGESRLRTGTVVDECHSVGTAAEQMLVRVYRSNDKILGNRVDTVVDSWSSLQPRSHHGTTTRETTFLDWADGRIRGRSQSMGAAAVPVDEVFPASAYNSASFDLILRASPLALGYDVAVPAYISSRGVVTLTAKVVGEELIGDEAAWRVDADFTGMAVTFWIAKSSRRLLKQVMHTAPGTSIEFLPLNRKTVRQRAS